MQSVDLVLAGQDDVDDEELHELAASLRRRLLEHEVDDVRPGGGDGPIPTGAKAGAAVAVGTLAVTLSPLMLRSTLRVIETWMKTRPVRKVTVTVEGRTLELSAASAEDQARLVDAFISAQPAVAAEAPDNAG